MVTIRHHFRYPRVVITQEMIDSARSIEHLAKVHRTQASPVDTLGGILGEYCFSGYGFGDWRLVHPEHSRGKIDFGNIEVKTSVYPFRPSLRLLVREDYAAKRKPDAYVQIVIDVKDRSNPVIEPGIVARLCGWATSMEVDMAPKIDPGAKGGGPAGFLCHAIPIMKLRHIDTFIYADQVAAGQRILGIGR